MRVPIKIVTLIGGFMIAHLQVATAAKTDESPQGGGVGADPYMWLEDVESTRALDWVREQNAVSAKELEALPGFESTRKRLLAVYESDARIPFVSKQGSYFYNFWRDARNVRGVLRRTSLEEYRKPEPDWETVLDIDALATNEKENWVWNGFECAFPDYERCILRLSRGGGDTVVLREFDVIKKEFVADGFVLPAGKIRASWRNRNTLYVGTDFGPGSLTDSGYPRLVKSWTRGTPIEKAEVVFEGQPGDVSSVGFSSDERDYHREFIYRSINFFSGETYLNQDGKLLKLPIPDDATIQTHRSHVLIQLRKDWTVGRKTYPGGALLAMDWQPFLAGNTDFEQIFTPTARTSLTDIVTTRNYVIIHVLDNVRSRLYALNVQDGAWARQPLPTPEFGTVGVWPVDPIESDDYFLTSSDFLTPTTFYMGRVGSTEREQLKQTPAFFDAAGLEVSQHEAKSRDGTRVPYFQVSRKGLKLNGKTPTLLYGYGGFQISTTANYSPTSGLAWLEQGGVYVLANIRGGGEFGPSWHQAALKANRQRAFDDFIAVAEDLHARKVTSPKHLGILGGSNGGLLTGVMLTQRPELFGAVVCQVPLLDMQRYHKLLAGASWMAEYGDPDKPEEWQYIRKYSPYQNVEKSKRYPRVLFTTSTRDDRVHPGHARKMVAKMKEQGHDILFYENIEGGHGGAANNKQQAYMSALAFTFLLKQLR